MDHVVYVDAKAGELKKLLEGKKSMLIRGAAGRKMPYGRVNVDDTLYLVENDGSGLIKASAVVCFVLNSEKMSGEESKDLVDQYQDRLRLTSTQVKRWAGKRYLVLVEISNIQGLDPFRVDKSEFGNMDDWLAVGDIENVALRA
jgi:hypothetical protein